jgi:hypothetical protein
VGGVPLQTHGKNLLQNIKFRDIEEGRVLKAGSEPRYENLAGLAYIEQYVFLIHQIWELSEFCSA